LGPWAVSMEACDCVASLLAPLVAAESTRSRSFVMILSRPPRYRGAILKVLTRVAGTPDFEYGTTRSVICGENQWGSGRAIRLSIERRRSAWTPIKWGAKAQQIVQEAINLAWRGIDEPDSKILPLAF
jgi:hypothetical protein